MKEANRKVQKLKRSMNRLSWHTPSEDSAWPPGQTVLSRTTFLLNVTNAFYVFKIHKNAKCFNEKDCYGGETKA